LKSSEGRRGDEEKGVLRAGKILQSKRLGKRGKEKEGGDTVGEGNDCGIVIRRMRVGNGIQRKGEIDGIKGTRENDPGGRR